MNAYKPLALTIVAASLAACSSSKEALPELDYQSNNRNVVRLDVPPDLNDPNQGDRYQLPAGGSVRASDLNRTQNTQQAAANSAVLTKVDQVHLERDGSVRWLNVGNKQPAELWPLLKAFWQEQGFVIAREEPAIGLMETEWAENRAKLPQDGIRRLFERVGLGGVYSTGERDKFTIRLERNGQGGTDVFVVHRGMREVYTNKQEDTTMWEPRPNDPNLEAAFLARFMQYLGADEQQIQRELTQQQNRGADLARIDNNTLIVNGAQERNWRRVALALDRIGLAVVAENPQRHAFLVEIAPAEGAAVSNRKPSFFSRLFGGKRAETENQAQPRLVVVAEPAQNATHVRLLNQDGSPYSGRDARQWLERLHTELR